MTHVANRQGFVFKIQESSENKFGVEDVYEQLDVRVIHHGDISPHLMITEEGSIINMRTLNQFKFNHTVEFIDIMWDYDETLILDENGSLWSCCYDILKGNGSDDISSHLTLVDTDVQFIGKTMSDMSCYIKNGFIYCIKINGYNKFKVVDQIELPSTFIRMENRLMITEEGIALIIEEFKNSNREYTTRIKILNVIEPDLELIGCAINDNSYMHECNKQLQAYYRSGDRIVIRSVTCSNYEGISECYISSSLINYMHQCCPWVYVCNLYDKVALINRDGLVIRVEFEGEIIGNSIPKSIFKTPTNMKKSCS
jgi:hypothetical protein